MTLEIELPDLPMDEDEPVEIHRGVKKYVHHIVDAWFRTPVRIAATVLLVLVCLGLIVWNLSRLSILDELVELEVTEYQLDAQLSDLQFELASIDVDGLKRAIEEENDKVFQGFPELAAWAEGLARVAQAQGIIFSYKAQPPHLSPVPDVLEVPLELQFKASAETADSLFNKSMDLIGRILRDHWHVDVVAISADGTGDALVSVSMQAQVWVRDRFGFVDVATLEPIVDEKANNDLDLLDE
jgi:hypothetical protein